MSTDFNQWSSVRPFIGTQQAPTWIPEHDRDRIAAYRKYDELYWNDAKQFALRVLEGEYPLYIPNARQIVDTTSHYLLKGLQITVDGPDASKKFLNDFLKRETFYSRFNTSKQAGVTRGDWVLHLTANPSKAPGQRITLTGVEPSRVFPVYDPEIPERLIACHIASEYLIKTDPGRTFIRALTYRLVEDGNNRKVSREEAVYSQDTLWWGDNPTKVKQILPFGFLDERITSIPIYWMKNRSWEGDDFGSSELRGFENIIEVISQGATDVSAALSLEGLGVYATDGGRPVDQNGNEVDWEVAPGKVMEVPQGSYFRRIEGVGSITPAKDQIDYLEKKLNTAAGLTDVALGTVDAVTAESGIALAIRFQPTLAKIEVRDQHGIDILTQLFYDWKTWVEVFERQSLDGDIIPVIGDKLPQDRVAKVNELNNMFDRKTISKQFYRDEMEKLGYKFPKDIEQQIIDEQQAAAEAARLAFVASSGGPDSVGYQAQAPAGGAGAPASDAKKAPPAGAPQTSGKPGIGNPTTLPPKGNRSNNRQRPNESAGTEAK